MLVLRCIIDDTRMIDIFLTSHRSMMYWLGWVTSLYLPSKGSLANDALMLHR